MTTYSTVLCGHIRPEDKERSDYQYIAFDLPFDAARVHVSYDYSCAHVVGSGRGRQRHRHRPL